MMGKNNLQALYDLTDLWQMVDGRYIIIKIGMDEVAVVMSVEGTWTPNKGERRNESN